MNIKFYGNFAKNSGYARAFHDYCLTLKRYTNVQLQIVPLLDAKTEDLDDKYKELIPLTRSAVKPDVVIVHTIPAYAHEFVTGNLDPGPGVLKVCMTTWETDRLPEWIANRLEVFDLIIVPSAHNQHVFENAMGLDRVAVLPHCYEPSEINFKQSLPKSSKRFLWIGAWMQRKNPIGVAIAFLNAFGNTDLADKVELTLHTSNRDGAAADLVALIRCSALDKVPKITLSNDRLSQAELIKLHREHDCYVSPHRGEGFGLGMFESAIVGNHIIHTGWSGGDFLYYLLGYYDSVGWQSTPAIVPEVLQADTQDFHGLKLKSVTHGAPTGIDITQCWAEPNLLYTSQAMRNLAYDHKTIEIWATKNQQEMLRSEYSYETVANQLVNELQDLLA